MVVGRRSRRKREGGEEGGGATDRCPFVALVWSSPCLWSTSPHLLSTSPSQPPPTHSTTHIHPHPHHSTLQHTTKSALRLSSICCGVTVAATLAGAPRTNSAASAVVMCSSTTRSVGTASSSGFCGERQQQQLGTTYVAARAQCVKACACGCACGCTCFVRRGCHDD